jgi:hypothetical protein
MSDGYDGGALVAVRSALMLCPFFILLCIYYWVYPLLCFGPFDVTDCIPLGPELLTNLLPIICPTVLTSELDSACVSYQFKSSNM